MNGMNLTALKLVDYGILVSSLLCEECGEGGSIMVNFRQHNDTDGLGCGINTGDSTPHASGNAANQAGSSLFPKPALSFEEQLNHLIENNLIVNDDAFAIACLSNINYYRLRGYWLTLEDGGGHFRDGVSFEGIWDIYELDRKLRLWLWKAIGPIEVKARTQFAYYLSHYVGPLSYLDASNFWNERSHAKSMCNFERERDRARNQNVPYVVHNMDRYGNLPVWAAVEVMSFGTLSQLYGNLRHNAGSAADHPGVYDAVADAFGMRAIYLKSWLHHLTTVRNIAGHHDRFYNRVMAIRPRLLTRDARYQCDKGFPTLLVIKNIYELSWPDRWADLGGELTDIIGSHPGVELRPMGFPGDWERVLDID